MEGGLVLARGGERRAFPVVVKLAKKTIPRCAPSLLFSLVICQRCRMRKRGGCSSTWRQSCLPKSGTKDNGECAENGGATKCQERRASGEKNLLHFFSLCVAGVHASFPISTGISPVPREKRIVERKK